MEDERGRKCSQNGRECKVIGNVGGRFRGIIKEGKVVARSGQVFTALLDRGEKVIVEWDVIESARGGKARWIRALRLREDGERRMFNLLGSHVCV